MSITRLASALVATLSFLALSMSASAAPQTSSKPGVAPTIFEGYYVLTHAALGDCSPEMLINAYTDNDGSYGLEAGFYSFMRINKGAWTDTGGGIRVSEKTYTTADQRLVSVQHTYDPAEPSTTNETISFHLVGEHLSVRSDDLMSMPGLAPADAAVSCEYKRVKCEQTTSGCN